MKLLTFSYILTEPIEKMTNNPFSWSFTECSSENELNENDPYG